ncbi:platelet-activating factor acetylhydrolase 2, cytoplasmic isoform X2 [Falco peregrinus]|uniref:platelet-activating factor acetylhydrolase 2, cytoplasmic isoform X2 n=1 Tax=Falco peregrinus TaxID=8954 RepID=UPI002478822E|nr:platelet-activating factor acetylhydrolase 2, cytoplasmic isoform X2 [Falco peregrinus]
MGGTQSLALPLGKGPHHVGCTDVMVGQTRQGLFLRLFYPCLPRAGAEWPLWIPRYEYCGGLADFAHRSRHWCAPLLSITIGPCTPRSAQSWHPGASWWRHWSTEAGREEWIPYQRVPQGQKEFYFRNKQVHQRAEECVRALRLFKDISSGKSVPNILHQDFDLSVLKDSVDLTKVAVMGHSFGGVTAVLALVKEPSFRCAVALDAWMFPLENVLYPEVPKPVLFINTEKFQTPESIAKMKRLSSRNSQTKIITILGSVHQSQTDFTFLTGKLNTRIFGARGTLDPYKGLDITSRAALAFLQRHLNLEEEFDRWDNLLEGIGDSVVPEAPFCRSNL